MGMPRRRMGRRAAETMTMTPADKGIAAVRRDDAERLARAEREAAAEGRADRVAQAHRFARAVSELTEAMTLLDRARNACFRAHAQYEDVLDAEVVEDVDAVMAKIAEAIAAGC